MLVCLIAVAGLFRFQNEFILAHYPEILMVLGLFVAEAVVAILRYGKISSFHTVLNRIAAYAQGICSSGPFHPEGPRNLTFYDQSSGNGLLFH